MQAISSSFVQYLNDSPKVRLVGLVSASAIVVAGVALAVFGTPAVIATSSLVLLVPVVKAQAAVLSAVIVYALVSKLASAILKGKSPEEVDNLDDLRKAASDLDNSEFATPPPATPPVVASPVTTAATPPLSPVLDEEYPSEAMAAPASPPAAVPFPVEVFFVDSRVETPIATPPVESATPTAAASPAAEEDTATDTDSVKTGSQASKASVNTLSDDEDEAQFELEDDSVKEDASPAFEPSLAASAPDTDTAGETKGE